LIGEVFLVVLAALATVGSAGIAPLDIVRSVAPPPAHSRDGQCGWESTEGVPVSLSIQNHGEEDDRLLGASSPIARCVVIHRTRFVSGRPVSLLVPGGLVIHAEATITLEPGSSHLALFGLQADLVQGETFPLTLYFDRAGEVKVVARVRRKVDAAGTTPLPTVSVGDLTISRVSAQPAPAASPIA
jgi:copper(I)-binding protein